MYSGVKQQSGQFVKETSADIYSYLETGTTILARTNNILVSIAMNLFDRDIPFQMANNLQIQFQAYCDESHDDDTELQGDSLENWFMKIRKQNTDDEILEKFKRLT